MIYHLSCDLNRSVLINCDGLDETATINSITYSLRSGWLSKKNNSHDPSNT